MPEQTRWSSQVADVLINYELCTSCGLCAAVCKGYPLYMEGDILTVDQSRGFGCIACGACVAVCPSDAIRISGRDMSLEDILPIPPVSRRSDYDSLQNLLLARRSTRQFTDEEIDPVTIEKILDAASTAPVGFPPSDVGVLVLSTREAVRNASRTLLKEIASWKTLFSPVPLALMSPFIGKENTVMFRDFIVPAVEMMTRKASQGED